MTTTHVQPRAQIPKAIREHAAELSRAHLLEKAGHDTDQPFWRCVCGARAIDPLSLLLAGNCERPDREPIVVETRRTVAADDATGFVPAFDFAVTVRPSIKRIWTTPIVNAATGERGPAQYVDDHGFVAEAYLDSDHTIKTTNRYPSPIAALAALQLQIEEAVKSKVIHFDKDGRLLAD